ncbi:hypothetical protein MHYP_G00126770 [Metynnis hypsauchen]
MDSRQMEKERAFVPVASLAKKSLELGDNLLDFILFFQVSVKTEVDATILDHAVVAAERAGDLGVTANTDPTTYTSLVKCQAHSSAGSAPTARRFESHCQLSVSRA